MSKRGQQDEPGFMEYMTDVRRLESDRVDLLQQRPKPKPRVSRHDGDSHFSDDSGSPANMRQEIPQESWFQHGLSKKLQRRIKSGKVEIESVLDLHGFSQHQAARELGRFLDQALSNQLRFLLIIHGKGIRSQSQAKLRPLVQRWLLQQPAVLAFCPAQPRDGGNGASYVHLKEVSGQR